MSNSDNASIFSVKTPQGEYKSLGMHLKEQREQIARAIEMQAENIPDSEFNRAFAHGIFIASEIARGKSQ